MADQHSKTESSPNVEINPLAPTRIGLSDSSYNSHQEDKNRSTQAYTEDEQDDQPENANAFIPFEVNDRYRIDQLLGSGSFGAVYLAWDKKLERRVAFKVARRDQFESSDGRQQFIEEARASAKIRHSNVVSVHDTGEDEQGNPYVVLEYIDGVTLDVVSNRKNLSEIEIARLCATIAEAIHVAHRLGIVHRDLKPGNILVDSEGHPHVADFGLAVTEITQRIRRGEVAGSPVYMSPEQVKGKTQFLDGRSDIWSIGVILYELLTGRLPFQAQVVGELYQEILEREPKPPRQIDDKISPELERICLKCLTKSVQGRYPTAIDLADELNRLCVNREHGDTPSASKPRYSLKKLLLLLASLTAASVVSVFCYSVLFPEETNNNTQSSQNKSTPSGSELRVDVQPVEEKELKPIRGEWFPLLARDPIPFLWPDSFKNSDWKIDKHSRELWVRCNVTGLLDLGKVDDDTFELQMDLYQTPWDGGFGVYVGRQTIQDGDDELVILQIFDLQCIKQSNTQRNSLNQSFLTLKNGEFHSKTTPRKVFLGPLNPTEEYSFHISVHNGRIDQLKWNKKRLKEFEAPLSDPALGRFRLEGAYGIYLERASAVVRQAEFYHPLGSNDEQSE